MLKVVFGWLVKMNNDDLVIKERFANQKDPSIYISHNNVSNNLLFMLEIDSDFKDMRSIFY